MIVALYRRHTDLIRLTILFAAFRLCAIFFSLPGGQFGVTSDHYFYHSFAEMSLSGKYPLLDYWMEYPPVFPWLVLGVYRASLDLPVLGPFDMLSWFSLLLNLVLLPFAVGNLILLYVLSLRIYGEMQIALRVTAGYALLFVPLFVAQGWFDEFAAFWLLLGLWAMLSQRPVLAGLATGIGFMVKLVPAILLPVMLRYARTWNARMVMLLATAAIVLAIALPFALRSPQFLLASFVVNGTRGAWESPWALIDGYYGAGKVTPLETRTDLQTLNAAQPPSRIPWAAVTAAFALVGALLYTRRIDWQDGRKATAFVALTLVLFMLYNRGYSPQFLAWLLPFVVLLLPNSSGLAYALALSLLNLLEWPIYFRMMPDFTPLFVVIVLGRSALLLGLAIEFGAQVFGRECAWAAWRPRAVLLGTAATALLIIGTVAVIAAPANLPANPAAPLVSYLRGVTDPGDLIILPESPYFYRLYPGLPDRAYYVPPRPQEPDKPVLQQFEARELARLEQHMALAPRVWLLAAPGNWSEENLKTLEAWLAGRARRLNEAWSGNTRVVSFGYGSRTIERLEDGSIQFAIDLSGQIGLRGARVDRTVLAPGESLGLSLFWLAVRPPEHDYSIFIHLRTAEGKTAAQYDGLLADGAAATGSWRPGNLAKYRVRIPIGDTVPAGKYTIVTGLYTPNGPRLEQPGGAGNEIVIGTFDVR